MNKPVKNIAVSTKQKLLNLAKKQGADYQRTLVRYAIERLLFRLSRHPVCKRFILKGATLLISWPERTFRPSGDLDLLGHGPSDVESMTRLFAEISVIEDEADGVIFDPASIAIKPARDDDEDQYQGLRIALDARLDTAVIKVLVDIGFGDVIYPEPREITLPCLLPDMLPPKILAYPAETVIAEKFEAMVRYGAATSRVKDFFDIWTIAKTFGFAKAALAQAVRGTFERRGTALPAEIPFALTQAFVEIAEKRKMWEGFLRRSPPAVAPPTFDEVIDDLRQFLGPVISSLDLLEGAAGSWDPSTGWSV